MVLSKSTKEFQILIEEEYKKLIEKRRQYYLSIYQNLVRSKKEDSSVLRFLKLIKEDIESVELLTLAYKLSNS